MKKDFFHSNTAYCIHHTLSSYFRDADAFVRQQCQLVHIELEPF